MRVASRSWLLGWGKFDDVLQTMNIKLRLYPQTQERSELTKKLSKTEAIPVQVDNQGENGQSKKLQDPWRVPIVISRIEKALIDVTGRDTVKTNNRKRAIFHSYRVE